MPVATEQITTDLALRPKGERGKEAPSDEQMAYQVLLPERRIERLGAPAEVK